MGGLPFAAGFFLSVFFPTAFDLKFGKKLCPADRANIPGTIAKEFFVGIFVDRGSACLRFFFRIVCHVISFVMMGSAERPLANCNSRCTFQYGVQNRFHCFLVIEGVAHLKRHQHRFDHSMHGHGADGRGVDCVFEFFGRNRMPVSSDEVLGGLVCFAVGLCDQIFRALCGTVCCIYGVWIFAFAEAAAMQREYSLSNGNRWLGL